MRVLDLGCGSGSDLSRWGVTATDEVTGLDIDGSRLEIARSRFPQNTYLHGSGERLPFENERFDRVVSSVALPYMNIPRALAQIYRTLAPGGSVSLSLHPPRFTLDELLHQAMPKLVPTLFRLYVMANGAFFHCTGKTLGLPNGRTESFQTERGMRRALRHTGFVDVSFRRELVPAGEAFIVDARKPDGVRKIV